MTIHITDIPNESFNHYKHVLHVDNEFALIEINKDNISDLPKTSPAILHRIPKMKFYY